MQLGEIPAIKPWHHLASTSCTTFFTGVIPLTYLELFLLHNARRKGSGCLLTSSGKQTSLPPLHSSKNASSVGVSFSNLGALAHHSFSGLYISPALGPPAIIHYPLAYFLLKSLNHMEKLTRILKKRNTSKVIDYLH